jgi:hypothetical protein
LHTGKLGLFGGRSEEAPTVANVEAIWAKQVFYAPDPTRNGAMSPGLAGKLYFFGPDHKQPLIADGNVIIDLYDDTSRPDSSGPRPIEKWSLDCETLQRFLKRDLIGNVYTVMLPWGTQHPGISQVHFTVRYEPRVGEPISITSMPIMVDHAKPPVGAILPGPVVPVPGPSLPQTAPNMLPPPLPN